MRPSKVSANPLAREIVVKGDQFHSALRCEGFLPLHVVFLEVVAILTGAHVIEP